MRSASLRYLLFSCLAIATVAAAIVLPPPTPAQADKVYGYAISRGEVLARAHYWLAQNVPYSQSATYPDPEGREYRTDCSGFIAMAWHLNYDTPSTQHDYWTGSLPEVSYTISKSSLKQGDILMINWGSSSGHVVLFEKWTDADHTRVNVIAQANTADDMDYYEDVPLSNFSGYTAFRYDNIYDEVTTTDTAIRAGTTTCQTTMMDDPTIDLPDRRDMYVSYVTCISRTYQGGTVYTYTAWTTAYWSPGQDSDDSSDMSKRRFDGFHLHVQLQLNNRSRGEAECSLAGDMNASYYGERSCAYTITTTETGEFTADGFAHWSKDGDGKHWLKPQYMQGSHGLTA